MLKRLHHMKETLVSLVEMQITNLADVDTEELGEAIDMIKDLEEAIYYCTVTEAMNKTSQKEEQDKMYFDYMYNRNRREDGTFYNDSHSGTYNTSNGSKGQSYNMMNGGHNYNDNTRGMNYSEAMPWRDEREGRSYSSRRMYMEAKETQKDKAIQLRELEKYMQELSQDITEMISDSSPEEKQYLEKKITALASKIGQMK